MIGPVGGKKPQLQLLEGAVASLCGGAAPTLLPASATIDTTAVAVAVSQPEEPLPLAPTTTAGEQRRTFEAPTAETSRGATGSASAAEHLAATETQASFSNHGGAVFCLLCSACLLCSGRKENAMAIRLK